MNKSQASPSYFTPAAMALAQSMDCLLYTSIKEPGETEEYLIGTDILLDTALCARGNIPEEQLTRMIRRHGAEKVLLGSDFPWHRSEEEIALIRSLPLTEEEKAMILGGNAQRLLGL